jgi:hypothetical protein
MDKKQINNDSFWARGEAAWQRHLSTQSDVPAEVVIALLQAKLDVKRRQLGLPATWQSGWQRPEK